MGKELYRSNTDATHVYYLVKGEVTLVPDLSLLEVIEKQNPAFEESDALPSKQASIETSGLPASSGKEIIISSPIVPNILMDSPRPDPISHIELGEFQLPLSTSLLPTPQQMGLDDDTPSSVISTFNELPPRRARLAGLSPFTTQERLLSYSRADASNAVYTPHIIGTPLMGDGKPDTVDLRRLPLLPDSGTRVDIAIRTPIQRVPDSIPRSPMSQSPSTLTSITYPLETDSQAGYSIGKRSQASTGRLNPRRAGGSGNVAIAGRGGDDCRCEVVKGLGGDVALAPKTSPSSDTNSMMSEGYYVDFVALMKKVNRRSHVNDIPSNDEHKTNEHRTTLHETSICRHTIEGRGRCTSLGNDDATGSVRAGSVELCIDDVVGANTTQSDSNPTGPITIGNDAQTSSNTNNVYTRALSQRDPTVADWKPSASPYVLANRGASLPPTTPSHLSRRGLSPQVGSGILSPTDRHAFSLGEDTRTVSLRGGSARTSPGPHSEYRDHDHGHVDPTRFDPIHGTPSPFMMRRLGMKDYSSDENASLSTLPAPMPSEHAIASIAPRGSISAAGSTGPFVGSTAGSCIPHDLKRNSTLYPDDLDPPALQVEAVGPSATLSTHDPITPISPSVYAGQKVYTLPHGAVRSFRFPPLARLLLLLLAR